MQITRHARERAAERQGADKAAARRNAQQALKHGKRRQETTGGLRRYLDALFKKYRTANNIKTYQNFVYIFRNGVLITLFQLPERFSEEAGKKPSSEGWVSCADCTYLTFSDCYGECGKRLRIVRPDDGCWIGERKEK